MRKEKAEVKTEYFEFVHGKKPRGYGAWKFTVKFDSSSRRNTFSLDLIGSYGACAREIARTAYMAGAYECEVEA